MASKSLDLSILIKVLGAEKVAALEKALEEMVVELKKIDGLKTLDKLLGDLGKPAEGVGKINTRLDQLVQRLAEVKAAGKVFEENMAKAAAKAAVELGKAQDAALKLNAAFDKRAAAKAAADFDRAWNAAIKMDAAFDKAQRNLGLMQVKAEAANAALDSLKSDKARKAAEDAEKAARALGLMQIEAQKMNAAFDRLRVEKLQQVQKAAQEASTVMGRLGIAFKAMASQQDDAAKAATRHATAVGGLTRDVLFFRRAIVGLGIAALSSGVLEVAKSFDKARQSIAAVFGQQDAAAQFEFIRVQAERLGISVTDLATQYAKFSAAAKSLGLSQEIVRDNFLAVAEAGGKLSLSSQEIEGALTAIQQIASKGRLSMEELRQQLGDRLPGAISIAAKGLGLTEARLFALVEQGKITSEMFLRTFPAALRASFGTDVNTRIETTTAIIQRFKNGLAELTDTALRAGALDAFTTTVKALTDAFKDPRVVSTLQQLSRALATLINFTRENIKELTALLAAFLALRAINAVVATLSAFGASLVSLAKGIQAYSAAATLAAGSTTALATASAAAITPLKAVGIILGTLSKLTLNPIVLSIVGLTAFKVAVDDISDSMGKALDKQLELNDAMRTASSQERIVAQYEAHAEALSVYADTVVKAKAEIEALGEEQLRSYAESAEGAKLFAEQAGKAVQARIEGIKAEIKAIQLSGNTSAAMAIEVANLTAELNDLTEILPKTAEMGTKFAGVLEQVQAAASKNDIALDPFVQGLRDLTAGFGSAQQGVQKFVEVFDFARLDKETQGLVAGFRKTIEEGKGVQKAFEDMIPKDFAQGGIKEIAQVGNALALLEKEGSIAAHVIGDELAKAMDKLDADALQKFGINAQAAFEMGTLAAKGLSFVLEGQLSASMKNLGLDADNVEKNVSKSFQEMSKNLRLVAENGKATGEQLRAALDVTIEGAKTREELLLIQETVQELGLEGGKMGAAISDSLLRLQDKIRLTTGIFNTVLGDSMKRLGVVGKEQLKALADQAVIDFDRIKTAGVAASLEVEAAWRQMAEAVIAANNGIPPISIQIQAVDFNAFDIIVKAAETAGERVKKAIEDAIPLADTEAKLIALSDAIELSFEKGKLAADDFGKMITEVGYQIREMAAKPVGELAAAADLLGLKTKEQLQAVADNTRDAFQAVAQSGEFTNAQLAKGAQQFMDAYIAANNGVVDSFDPVVQKAQEVLASVNATTDALVDMATATRMSDPITTGVNIRDMGTQELQQYLQDTMKAYRAIGIQNVEDLQIVQAVQQELQRKGQEQLARMLEADQKLNDSINKTKEGYAQNLDSATSSRGSGPGGGGTLPGGGGSPITFNFNGTGISPEAVRREVVPILNDQALRRR